MAWRRGGEQHLSVSAPPHSRPMTVHCRGLLSCVHSLVSLSLHGLPSNLRAFDHHHLTTVINNRGRALAQGAASAFAALSCGTPLAPSTPPRRCDRLILFRCLGLSRRSRKDNTTRTQTRTPTHPPKHKLTIRAYRRQFIFFF